MANLPKFLVPLSVCGTAVGGIVILKDYIGGVRVSPDVKITGRTAIVTGANSGIGKEVAYDLAHRGARVIMACRDLKKCEEVCEQIKKDTFNLNVHCKRLDLASTKSVKEFAHAINKNEKRLDILINNAGVMGINPKEITKEGFEKHFGVNFLGHFLLTNLLLDKLKSSSPSRIINTSNYSKFRDYILNFEDLNLDKNYDWKKAYDQSKFANILFTKELHEKLKDTQVSTFCVLPSLTNTDISRHLNYRKSVISRYILYPFYWLISKTPEQGAQSTIYAAVEPVIQNSTDKILVINSERKDIGVLTDIDATSSSRLWLTAEKWTGTQT